MKTSHVISCVITLVAIAAPGQAQWSLNGVKVFYNAGNVGIGTNDPAFKLDVRGAGTRSISGLATAATGPTNGVYGQSMSKSGRGVGGFATATTGPTYGVFGQANSPAGVGVYGLGNSATGTNYGVFGKTNSPNGFAGYFIGGRSFFQNNVGIGTVTPAAKLEVLQTTQAAIGLQVKNNATRILTAFGNGSVLMGPVDSIAGAWVGADNTGGIPAAIIGHQAGIAAVSRIRMTDDKLAVISGAVGIGVVDPTFQLHLSLNSAAKPTSNTWTIASDERLKKNINPISEALDRVLQLRGVTYAWIDPQSHGGMAGTYTGMIAQDVEKVFPEWVSQGADGYKRLTVIGFEGIVVEAMRELREEKDHQIASLRLENATQQQMIADLAARFAELEKRLQYAEKPLEQASASP